MASIVMVYGVLLAVLGFALQQIAPVMAKVTFIVGLTGGGLCVLCGIAALAGHKHRTWAVLTLVVVSFIVLTQVVQAWSAFAIESAGGLTGALLLTLMLLLTVGMLTYLLHGERPPDFYSTRTGRGGQPGTSPE